jgi:hypothetical protein
MLRGTQTGTSRVRYFQGQNLRARDLQDEDAYEARMRGMHIRALHNTWGVALGFEVRINDDGDALLVGPGIAYDCRGREVVSGRSLAIEPPAPPPGSPVDTWWYDLLIRHHDLQALLAGRNPAESCPGTGIRPTEERPAWRWSFAGRADEPAPSTAPGPAADVRLGEEIPLARARVTAERRVAALDFSQRRNAQGLVRPHITGEQVLALARPLAASILCWTTQIDTTAGGFSQTPFYQVRLAEYPPLAQLLGQSDEPLWLRAVLGPFLSVHAPTRRGFTLEVRFAVSGDFGHWPWPHIVGDGPEAMSTTAMVVVTPTLPLQVHWLGIEPVGGCPPLLRLMNLFHWSGFQYWKPIFELGSEGRAGPDLRVQTGAEPEAQPPASPGSTPGGCL